MTDFNIDALRDAADNHREVADKADALILALEALYEGTPTASSQPRFYVEQINGIWGARDRENPDEWASWDADELSEEDAKLGASRINAGESREVYEWSPVGEH